VTNADRMRDDQLNDFLDALVAGETSREIDPATTEAARRFFATDDAPRPPRDLDSQIWEDLMNQTALADSLPLRPSVARPSINGRTQPRPWQRGPVAKTASHRLRRSEFVRLAIAAILLFSLGFGYLAFEPFRGDPDRPPKMPAAVAPAATPTAPLFPRTDHPIIGVWGWYDPCAPYKDYSYAIFDQDGTYTEYDDFGGVSVGRWRATGERTVELATIVQHPISSFDGMFEPGFTLPESVFEGRQATTWRAIEVDETGNTLTGTGYYEPRDDSGAVITHLEFGDECNFEIRATRLTVASIATPTS
jgi:hypothetical protein